MTHYETLGLALGSSAADIKAAYRRLALELHPDRNPAPEAAERFSAVAAAYEVLGDPERRQAYDRALATERAREAAEQAAEGGSDLFSWDPPARGVSEQAIIDQWASK